MKTHLILATAIAPLALIVLVGCESTAQIAQPVSMSGPQAIEGASRTNGPLYRPGPSGRSQHDIRRHGSAGAAMSEPVSFPEAEQAAAEITAVDSERSADGLPPNWNKGQVEFWPGNP